MPSNKILNFNIISVVPNLRNDSGVTLAVKEQHLELTKRGIDNLIISKDYILQNKTKTNFSYSYLIFNIFKNNKINIIHFHGLWDLFLFKIFLINNLFNFKIVLTTHGMLMNKPLSINKYKKKFALFFFQRYIIQKSKYIFVTSKKEKKETSQILKYSKNIIINPFGIKSNEYIPKSKKKIFLFISRIHPIKGLDILIKAWAKAKLKKWQLYICGPADDLSYLNKLKELKKINGLNSLKIFPKFINRYNKIKLFNRASYYVQISYSENFSFSILEALSMGLPVITSFGTPWHDIKKNGCGYYINSNINSLVSVFKKIDNVNYKDYEIMSKNAFILSKKYNWHDNINIFLKYLIKIT